MTERFSTIMQSECAGDMFTPQPQELHFT